jgi:citrate lyase subunit gamma (acyl carrier protein)
MNIMQKAMVGSLESCDCLIVVSPGDRLDIQIDSTVGKRFGAHIRTLVDETLRELRVASGQFTVTDRGALDYCIKARLITAARRGGAC